MREEATSKKEKLLDQLKTSLEGKDRILDELNERATRLLLAEEELEKGRKHLLKRDADATAMESLLNKGVRLLTESEKKLAEREKKLAEREKRLKGKGRP